MGNLYQLWFSSKYVTGVRINGTYDIYGKVVKIIRQDENTGNWLLLVRGTGNKQASTSLDKPLKENR